ncbi:TPA: autoinducer 2 ABC transporter permease LsrC [Escherichia coli]|nr:autoinducer 2 ABC transporter permease LsrC [Escherichia coli]HAJ1992488.1 autoinducer 2 ABC transporter permease LsrC [Escherichia coli]
MLKFIQNNREITALLAVVLLFVLPGFLDRQYLSVQTLTMVYSSAQILILLAMGATLVMLTRNIDVSVGSITGMCAVLLGMLLNAGYSLPVACVATLLLGLLAGFFNGVLLAWLKIPAIVATLGTLGLYRGIMLLWTGGKWIEGLPAELKQLSAPLLFGVSAIGWLTIILVAFMAWLLAKTAFGRSFYVTGDNLQGARQLGVRTEAIRIVAFSLNGCMAALAGIVFASQIGFIPNQTGTGLEMKAIAACVLGGISLLGGSGAIIGAVLGAWFLIQLVDAGMKVGMPTMAVTGVGKDMVRDQRYFSLATRIAAEMGAQIIKTYYVEKGFERIVAGCPVPIVIAGGKKLPEREALEMCWQAIDQGASGVDMGRNIFQSDHPVAMMKAVQAVVHHNETADRAYELYLSEKQ